MFPSSFKTVGPMPVRVSGTVLNPSCHPPGLRMKCAVQLPDAAGVPCVSALLQQLCAAHQQMHSSACAHMGGGLGGRGLYVQLVCQGSKERVACWPMHSRRLRNGRRDGVAATHQHAGFESSKAHVHTDLAPTAPTRSASRTETCRSGSSGRAARLAPAPAVKIFDGEAVMKRVLWDPACAQAHAPASSR